MGSWWNWFLWGDQLKNWPEGAGPRKLQARAILAAILALVLILLAVKAVSLQMAPARTESAETLDALKRADPQRCFDRPDGGSSKLIATVNQSLGAAGPLTYVDTNVTPGGGGNYQVAMTYRLREKPRVGSGDKTALATLTPDDCSFAVMTTGSGSRE